MQFSGEQRFLKVRDEFRFYIWKYFPQMEEEIEYRRILSRIPVFHFSINNYCASCQVIKIWIRISVFIGQRP